jgi:hypothetical protein
MAFFSTEKRKTRFSLSFMFNHSSRLNMAAHPFAARTPRFFEAPFNGFPHQSLGIIRATQFGPQG